MSQQGSSRSRVEVGAYVDPVAPLRVVGAGIKLARFLGADDIWMGDHTRAMLPASVWDPAFNPMAKLVPNLDAFFDPTALIAKYAGRRLRMGTSVTDGFRRSPADMARAWMTLHHATGGNAILGIGAGERENNVPYGTPYEKPVSRLEDMLGALRAAWDQPGEPVTHSGPFHQWREATFALPRFKGTTPPVWVAAQGPRACGAAGRFGDGWMHVHYGLEAWKQGADQVIAGAQGAGRNPQELRRSLLMAGMVVSSPDLLAQAVKQPVLVAAALALPAAGWQAGGADHPLGSGYSGPQDYEPELLTDEVMVLATKMMTPDLFKTLMPSGSAAEVASYLEQFVSRGVDHVIAINLAPAAGIKIGIDSLREQRKLNMLLKKMRPGRFDPS